MKLEVQTHHLQRSVHASDWTHESDADAAPGLSAVLLKGKNKCSSSAKPYYVCLISLADDSDTPPKSGYLLCVCVCVGGLWPLVSAMNNDWQTTFI